MGEDAAINNETAKRVVGKPFQPGQSGNPDGRPAVAKEFREWCKEIMATEGRKRLLAALKDPAADYHFRVIELLAGYAYGKPKQGVELTGEDGGPIRGVVILPEVLIAKAEEVVKRE